MGVLKWHITFSQIADGGDLELQMFGLTTKYNKMSEVTKTTENPAIGNVLLAAGVPMNPEYWINEIRLELYVRCKPKKVAMRLIKYYRQELAISKRYYACR